MAVCFGDTHFWLFGVMWLSVILKPSEKVPGAATIMARLFAEAGIPKGVFQVVLWCPNVFFLHRFVSRVGTGVRLSTAQSTL